MDIIHAEIVGGMEFLKVGGKDGKITKKNTGKAKAERRRVEGKPPV